MAYGLFHDTPWNYTRCLNHCFGRLIMKKTFFIFISSILPYTLFSQVNTVDSSESKWSFSASGYYYFIPEEANAGTLIGYADYKALHLEARYNYEDQNTGSAFGG